MRPVLPPAELERRVLAHLLDRAVVGALVGLALWPAHRLGQQGRDGDAVLLVLAVAAVVWLALALLEAATGCTPGKAATGLRTLAPGSRTPGALGPGLLRAAVLAAGGLPTAGIGLAVLGWTAATDPSGRRRGWHDLLGGVEVVDVSAPPAAGEKPPPPGLVDPSALRLAAPAGGDTVVRPRPAVRGAPDPSTWVLDFDHAELPVEEATLVGRDPRPRPGEEVAHLFALPGDPSVSRTHALLRVAADGALVVTDRGSANGTVLVRGHARRPLAPGRPTTLVAGDRLELGDSVAAVRRQPVSSPRATSYTAGVAAATSAPGWGSTGE